MSSVLDALGTHLTLELLEREGATVGVSDDHVLLLLGAPPWWPLLRTPELELRLRWAVVGRAERTTWRRCTACRREALRGPGAPARCTLTPRCAGKLVRVRLAAAAGAVAPCARPGCGYAAHRLLYAGVRLCELDAALAAIIATTRPTTQESTT